MPNLTEQDWAEIYYALEYKKTSPAVDGDKKWLEHLDNILETIGPDGSNMTKEAEPIRVIVEVDDGTVEGVYSNLERKDMDISILDRADQRYDDTDEGKMIYFELEEEIELLNSVYFK